MLFFLSLLAMDPVEQNRELFYFLQDKFIQISGELRNCAMAHAPYSDQVAINKELSQIDEFKGSEKLRNQLRTCAVILSILRNSCLKKISTEKYDSQLSELEFGCDVIDKMNQLREPLLVCRVVAGKRLSIDDEDLKRDRDVIVYTREKRRDVYKKDKRPKGIAQTVFFFARFEYQIADLILMQMVFWLPKKEENQWSYQEYYDAYDQALEKSDGLKNFVMTWLTR